MIDLLVLDDQNLRALAARQDIVNEFPFFSLAAAPAKQARQSCCGGARDSSWHSLNEIKRAIHELPMERKARLKVLLNARQVRLRFVNRNNVLVKLTF